MPFYLVQYDAQRTPVKYITVHSLRLLQVSRKLWAYEQVNEAAYQEAVNAVRTRNALKAKQKYKKGQ